MPPATALNAPPPLLLPQRISFIKQHKLAGNRPLYSAGMRSANHVQPDNWNGGGSGGGANSHMAKWIQPSGACVRAAGPPALPPD